MNDPIEVEVLSVDDGAPLSPPESAAPSRTAKAAAGAGHTAPWGHWQGRIHRLDPRWWPLWLVLGGIALVLLLTVGLVVAVLVVIFKTTAGLVRGILGLFGGGSRGTSLRL